MKRVVKVVAIILLVLLIDQSLKFWVKTGMEYGEEIKLLGLDWALIHFVENNGMAFGISLGGDYGKLALSLFRIIAVGFLVYYIKLLLDSKASMGLLASFALILAGALGNIFDSAFYGMIFSESPRYGGLAQFLPPEGGYSSFLHGKVVDMLYFPIFQGYFPSWFPIWGGEHFLFFKPVFNIADMSITIGVLNILIFQRSFFSNTSSNNEEEKSAEGLKIEAETTIVEDATNPSEEENKLSEELPTSEQEEDKPSLNQ